MTRRRASTANLDPGEHSADRATPRQQADGSWWLDFTVRLHDGQRRRHRAKGATESQARRRARVNAEKLLASTSPESVTLDRLAREIAELSARQRQALLNMVRDSPD